MEDEHIRRALLIGLDGATFSVLEPLMRDGTMPFLAEFTRRGVRAILHSTIHPLTPIAWTTLMTGRQPGSHGIFDFVRVTRDGPHPSYTLSTSSDMRVDTLWSYASRQGRRVTCLNFPCMFPPPAINGFVVPGFVPRMYLPRAVYPRDLYPRLKALPEFNAQELALDWDLERQALQGLPAEEFERWIKFHTGREQQWYEIARWLMQNEPCDLTAVLFDGVDKLQHLCFHLIQPDLASRYPSDWARSIRALCLSYFRQLDHFIESLVEIAGPDAQVFMASDHGFQAAGDQIFYANVWLEQHGYLRWAADVPLDNSARLTLEGHTASDSMFDWVGTTAFALTASSNAIFIRQAKGPGTPGVLPEDYGRFREHLIESLLAFTDPNTGAPIVSQVLTREQAFPGPEMKNAPDLTLVLHDRSFLSVLRADAALKPRKLPYGTHHPDGVFLAGGQGIRAGAELAAFSITDITPTLLYSLGLPISDEFEGVPAIDAFEPSFVSDHPICRKAPPVPAQPEPGEGASQAFEPGQEEEILQRLKALGYLE